jgi:FkbM family methyltransferase
MTPLLQFLTALRNAGLKIQTVYDIGACVGAWSKTVRQVLPEAEFILFEANPAYDAHLAATGFRHFTTLLSNPGRQFVDFFNGTNTGDSYYKETTKFYDQQSSIRLPCTTLAEVVAQNALPLPELIKLDTQGSELDILAGAGSLLDHVALIYTECPIVRYNAGAPDIQDYLDYFRDNDFMPVALLETHYMEHTLLQLDIMFMRKDAKERHLGPNINVRPFVS